MVKYLITEKISPHRSIDGSGYLICTDAICSRTGEQTYTKEEIYENYTGDDRNDEVTVVRPYDEVFDERALASFENKPVVVDHPSEDVNPENHNDYSVGFMRDIHQGKDGDTDVMLCTLVITDQDTIEKIQDGTYKYLSCGYDCVFSEENGKIYQRKIRGNHVAICGKPRAGITRIQDSIKTKAKSVALDFDDESIAIAAKTYLDKFNVPAKIEGGSLIVFAPTDEKLNQIVNLAGSKFKFEKRMILPAVDSAYGKPIERNTVTIRRGYHNLSPAADKFKEVYKLAMNESSEINTKMLVNCLEAMYIDAYNDSKEAYQKDIASIAIEKYTNALRLANDFKIKRKSQLNAEQTSVVDKYIEDIEKLCEEIASNAIPSTFKRDLLAMINKYNDHESEAVEGEESLSFNKSGKPTETEEKTEAEVEEVEEPEKTEKSEETEESEKAKEKDEKTKDSFDKQYTVIAKSPEEAAALVKLARKYVKK